jgi:hypothetical protein
MHNFSLEPYARLAGYKTFLLLLPLHTGCLPDSQLNAALQGGRVLRAALRYDLALSAALRARLCRSTPLLWGPFSASCF